MIKVDRNLTRTPMEDAFKTLYSTFSHYRIGDDFTGCDCCVGPEHCAALAKPPQIAFTDDDDFDYALPQLAVIRSSLADANTQRKT